MCLITELAYVSAVNCVLIPAKLIAQKELNAVKAFFILYVVKLGVEGVLLFG